MRLVQLLKGTPAELALEPAVAALGYPYRFQLPLWIYEGGLRYFPDFVIPDLSLVIEVDDRSHDHKVEADQQRTDDIARQHGWTVVRCTNEEALRDPVGTVERLTGQRALRAPTIPMKLPALASKLVRNRKKPSAAASKPAVLKENNTRSRRKA